MDAFLEESTIDILSFLYFENRELVHHYERVWTNDGMSYQDVEWAHIFMGMDKKDLPINEAQLSFFLDNKIIEETSGNEHESIYQLTDYYRTYLKTILSEKQRQEWENRKIQKTLT